MWVILELILMLHLMINVLLVCILHFSTKVGYVYFIYVIFKWLIQLSFLSHIVALLNVLSN